MTCNIPTVRWNVWHCEGLYVVTFFTFSDIVMEDSIRTADAMFNIQLILEFCCESLPLKTAHLSLNDLFYTNPVLKPNLLVFLAELFYHFEVNRIACVQPPSQLGDKSSVPVTSHTAAISNQAGPDGKDSSIWLIATCTNITGGKGSVGLLRSCALSVFTYPWKVCCLDIYPGHA